MTEPGLIWICAHGGAWSPVNGGTQDTKYIRADLHDAEIERLSAELVDMKAVSGRWMDCAEAAEAEVARLREALADALKEGMRIATCVPIEQVQEAFSAALRAIAEQEGK